MSEIFEDIEAVKQTGPAEGTVDFGKKRFHRNEIMEPRRRSSNL